MVPGFAVGDTQQIQNRQSTARTSHGDTDIKAEEGGAAVLALCTTALMPVYP